MRSPPPDPACIATRRPRGAHAPARSARARRAVAARTGTHASREYHRAMAVRLIAALAAGGFVGWLVTLIAWMAHATVFPDSGLDAIGTAFRGVTIAFGAGLVAGLAAAVAVFRGMGDRRASAWSCSIASCPRAIACRAS